MLHRLAGYRVPGTGIPELRLAATWSRRPGIPVPVTR